MTKLVIDLVQIRKASGCDLGQGLIDCVCLLFPSPQLIAVIPHHLPALNQNVMESLHLTLK